MRIPSQLGYVLSGTATLALLAGCSGGGAGTPSGGSAFVPQQSIGGSKVLSSRVGVRPQFTTSVLRPDAQKLRVNPNRPTTDIISEDALKPAGSVIFVSDAANGVVDIFNAAGHQTGQLTGFSEPQGLSSDKTAHLYVADTENSRIQIYAKPYKKATSLSDPGQYPADVDVDAKGNVGVTNIISTSGGSGSVSFYAKGKKSPTKTLTSSSLTEAFFGAFDAKGNFYFDGFDSNGATAVFEVVGGEHGTKITELALGNSLEFPGGVQVTTKGKIAVDDQEAFAIYTYNPPTGGSLHSPTATTSLSGSSDPVSYAFTKTNGDLYTADAGNAASYEFAYPAGGAAKQTISISGGQPIGVAIVPFENP